MCGSDLWISLLLRRFGRIATYQQFFLTASAPDLFVDDEEARAVAGQWGELAKAMRALADPIKHRGPEKVDRAAEATRALSGLLPPIHAFYRRRLLPEVHEFFGTKPIEETATAGDADLWKRQRSRNRSYARRRRRNRRYARRIDDFAVDTLAAVGVMVHWRAMRTAPSDWDMIARLSDNQCSGLRVIDVASTVIAAFAQSLETALQQPRGWNLPEAAVQLSHRLGELVPLLAAAAEASPSAEHKLKASEGSVFDSLWEFFPQALTAVYSPRELGWEAWPVIKHPDTTLRTLWTGHLCLGYGLLQQLHRLVYDLRAPEGLAG